MKKISNYPLTFSAPAATTGEQSEGVVLAAEPGGWPTQSSTPASRMIPLSSGQSSVIQSVDYPVAYSLGQAALTIPLYTVKQGDLEVPITLSYQGSGIKVDEIASPVGLGWTLNAGGSVVRQINGSVDTTPNKGSIASMNASGSSSGGTGEVTLTQAINAITGDAFRDKYYYGFPGGGGNFIIGQNGFNNDTITFSPKADEKGDGKSVGRFVIQNPYGVTHYFEDHDTMVMYDYVIRDYKGKPYSSLSESPDRLPKIVVEWHVSKIVSVDGYNSISFSYASLGKLNREIDSFVNTYRKSISASDADRFVQTVEPTEKFLNGIHYDNHSVAEINFGGNLVVFTYTTAPVNPDANDDDLVLPPDAFYEPNPRRRLSEIKVINCENEVIKRIVFENGEDQYDIKRYTLNRIKFYDGADNLYDQYDFTYYNFLNPVRAINSIFVPLQPPMKAQDHFGYYNGADTNFNLGFLTLYDDEFTLRHRRAYSDSHVHIHSLKAIKRLSGSKTEFIYEPNVHNDQRVGDINIGIRIKEINEYDENLAVKSRKFRYEQSGTTIDFSKIDLSAFLERRQIKNDAGEVYEYLCFSPYSLLPGVPMESARVFYGKVTEDVIDRVRNKTIRTEYYYNTTGWACEYVPQYYEKPVRSAEDAEKYIATQDYVYSVPSTPSAGKRRYVGEIRGYFKERTASFEALSKQIVYESIDANTFKPVEEIVYAHTRFNKREIRIGSYAKPMVTLLRLENPVGVKDGNWEYKKPTGDTRPNTSPNYMASLPGDCYYFGIYEDAYISKPTSVTTIKHYEYSTKSETVEYKYNHSAPYMYSVWPCTPYPNANIPDELNLATLQLKETFARKGQDNYKHRYLYPGSYVSYFSKMEDANNLYTCLGEEVIKNGTEVTANYTDYKSITRLNSEGQSIIMWKPAKKITCLNGETISETTYEEYDSYGNPVYVKLTGAPDTCYVWSYKGMYPVAEIKNVTYADLKERLGGDSALKAIQDATSHTAFINRLNALRGTLPDALITTYTYKPLVGITSITDPAGRIQTLHYDSAGRLAAVKDDVGSILESYEYAVKNS